MKSDAAARERALDPAGSFIVQAPAGAGKTGLLTQRFLRLLATVDAPEQIVAITFTIKAAAEMRARIVSALRDEAPVPAHENEHDRRTRELARLAREHAAQRNWKLDQHPARLRIQTIDAFCLGLAAQSPLLSRAGAELRINLEPRPLYAAAARRTFDALGDEGIGAALATVLRHRDNQVAPTLDLIADMLARRDQWLPIVLELKGAPLRARLEQDLEREVRAHLARVLERWPRENFTTVARLAGEGARRVPRESARLRAWRENPSAPREEITDLPLWRDLGDFLLTKSEGRWRRKFDINDGFAPHFRRDKDQLLDLLEELARLDGFDRELHCARLLPDPRIDEEQWEVAQALIDVLKYAAQALEIEFRASGQVDFIAVASAARQALGNADTPSELALALDYRIRHLLVDEFQDTSVSQFRLLEQLTAGWTPGDGRTLFCVGDPMQSIYRFRQAEVGLFLRTRDRGLAGLPLEPLVLTRNFRSQAALVEWSNQLFARVLAPVDDVARGAVKHAPSEHVHPSVKPSVTVHPFFDPRMGPEAASVVATVRTLLARHLDDTTIGILVRQRSHVREIAALLNQRDISYQAVELEPLGEQPVVRDLMAIARALLHEGDRTAWLALLRSPVCGLTLVDLELLTRDARDTTVRELMASETRQATLSEEGRRRLSLVLTAIERARSRHGSLTLRRRIESAWLELGGPAATRDRRALDNATAFLQRLDAIEMSTQGAPLPAGPAFEALFDELQARPDPLASPRVQVMTVHRAKGLEFDAVLLPGLGRSRGESDPELLYWMEVPQPEGASGLLLAPIARKGSESDALTNYVSYRVAECVDFERARLLYVATTRARRELHLFGHVRVRDKDGQLEMGTPDGGSALALLWPVVEPVFAEAFLAGGPAQLSLFETPAVASSSHRRLASDWQLPPPDPGVAVTSALARDPQHATRPDFDWASEAIRRIGTVVHGELERWSRMERLPAESDVALAKDRLARLLRASGVPRDLLDDAAERVIRALQVTLADDRGRWIFSTSHRERRSELALTGDIAGEIVSIVIDRTFLDADDTRWLIDFKTSTHEGGDREAFLDNEVLRYRPQLERYARLAQRLGPQAVRCGLYFPLLKGWREWSAT